MSSGGQPEAGDIAPVTVRRLIDLSMALDDSTPTYPGDPRPRACPAATIARDGFNVSALELGSHSGTHCDAPYHWISDGARIDELPLTRFFGPATVVDCSSAGSREPITWAAIEPQVAGLEAGTIILLHTGWSQYASEASYFDHPYLDGEACRRLLALGVLTIGIDAINIDETPTGAMDRLRFVCHEQICQAGGVIVENLTNLADVPKRGALVSVLPLRLTGGDGAPTRAVAIELA